MIISTILVALSATGLQSPPVLSETLPPTTVAVQTTPRRNPRPPGSGGADSQGMPGQRPEGQQGQDRAPIPLAEAVKDYKKTEGVFALYQKDDSVLIQIPNALLGRDFLWTAELKQTPSGQYSGTTVGKVLVYFELRGNRLLMRGRNTRNISSRDPQMADSVKASNTDPILEAFSIRAKGDDGAPLIDITRLVTSDFAELNVGRALGGTLDPQRTFLDRASVFQENLNVYVTATARANPAAAPTGGGGGGRGGFGRAPSAPSNTGQILHCLLLLPEKPMIGRYGDSRVGYFSTNVLDFGSDYHGAKSREFIARYRLEKKDPQASVSEVVKPIVYYVSREVPTKWREAIKQGIEDWQVAFESAGFKNAIIAKDQPDDPEWSPEDARFSVIRWAPLPIANAVGPHLADPRSGEIISAHVIVWHDILKLQTEWYFSQAAALDPRVRRLPMPDDLMAQMIRFVVSHEVGHTLGLPHNGKSSGMIPISKLRDAAWTKENGTCTSIMDYARFNYVAQPGDNASLMPKIGKYDKFAIRWGYMPITGVRRPEDETSELDALASAQVTDPELRFYDNFNPNDPTAQSESLGNDVVEASRLGVLNLKRTVPMLIPATVKLGEDYEELERMHGSLVSQMTQYCLHVATAVGGVEQIDWHGGRGGEVYNHVPAEYQRRAVAWLCDNAINPPIWLTPRDIVSKTTRDGGFRSLNRFQVLAIASLLNDARLTLMMQNETLNGAKAYTAREMFGTLRTRIWGDLQSPDNKPDLYRRNAQRLYVNALIDKLATPEAEIRAYATNELRTADANLKAIEGKPGDGLIMAHYRDLRLIIRMALENPPAIPPADATPTPGGRGGLVDQLMKQDPEFWGKFWQRDENGAWIQPGCSLGGRN